MRVDIIMSCNLNEMYGINKVNHKTMIVLRSYFCWLSLAIGLGSVYAQPGNKLNQIPPSPEASSLGKYNQYNVNLSTGLAGITIPLYTIQSRGVEIPISLSYHASGIKVNDVSSSVGLGFALNAGGAIVRSTRGTNDNGAQGYLRMSYLTQSQINTSTDKDAIFNYLTSIANGARDNESDIYYYNANEISGTFLYDINKQLVQMPITDNRIEGDIESGYTVTSENGTKYIFSIPEESYVNGGPKFISSTYLTKVIPFNGTDQDAITFIYFKDSNYYADISESYSEMIGTLPSWLSSSNFGTSLTYNSTNDTKVLQKILFPEGSIEFILSGDRKDRRKYRISEILIKDINSNLIKSIEFVHSYFETSSPIAPNYSDYSKNVDYRLRLDKVVLKDKGNKNVMQYSFGYNPMKLPIYWTGGTRTNWKEHYGQDSWGYYNGVISNDHLRPQSPNFQGADRSISTDHVKACILNQITYPTGGKTVFQYGSNFGVGIKVGGLRVEKISDYSEHKDPIVKTYQYGSGYLTEAYGYLSSHYNSSYTQGYVHPTNLGEFWYSDMYLSNPTLPLSYNSGNPVLYNKVVEYIGDQNSNAGKIEYEFEMENDSLYVTNVRTPSDVTGIPNFNKARYQMYIISTAWARGDIKYQRYYRRNFDGSYALIRVTYNRYQKFNWKLYNTGINVFGSWNYTGNKPGSVADVNTARGQFQYFDIYTISGVKKLVESVETNFDNLEKETVISRKKIYYEAIKRAANAHQQPTKIETDGSGVTYVEHRKYAFDYDNLNSTDSDASAILALNNANFKSALIETFTFLNNGIENHLISARLSTYKIQQARVLPTKEYVCDIVNISTNFTPSYVSTSLVKDSKYREELSYDLYDIKGNILSLTKNGSEQVSYLWGYNYSYPIAKVVNVFYQELQDILGQSLIDQLNSAPGTDAQMRDRLSKLRTNQFSKPVIVTTYTYLPLIGTTSITDSNGNINYYEYDYFGRLKIIRDSDNSILQKYSYHYKQ
jgi:hypothetical protein